MLFPDRDMRNGVRGASARRVAPGAESGRRAVFMMYHDLIAAMVTLSPTVLTWFIAVPR